MIIILEVVSVVLAWAFTIAVLTLIFDGTDGFKRNK